ncbi:MAG TPA: toll/interleukin-1 receptor domain-containing protein [Candidatus Angelobacter sp.]|jgi:hypothetical protein
MSPKKAKEILERLINNAAFLSGEQFGSAKRSEWTETARAVLERSFPIGSSILNSFETAQSFAFGADDTEQQLRDIANGALSSELAVLRSAVEQLNWEIEEETPMPVVANELAVSKSSLPIFVSHSSKDANLAEAIVDLLRSALALNASEIRCSSVDGYKLPVGVNTESKLREEVNAATVVIGLITPNSLASSYVMFELGARWGSGLFLAPLLAGVTPHELTGPLRLLNALSGENESDVHHLLKGVGEKLHRPLQNTASYIKRIATVEQLAREIHAADIKAAISQENLMLKAELASAKDQLEKKPKLKPYGNVHYYVVEGEDIPYCPTCFGTRGHLIPLPAGGSWNGGFRRQCPACHTFYYEKPMAERQDGGNRGGGGLSWMS